MSNINSRRTFFACLGLAILSTILFAASRAGLSFKGQRAVKVTYLASRVAPDGKRTPISTHVRTLAGGQMRRQEFRDGKLYIDQFIDADGVLYGVSHKRRELHQADTNGLKFDLKTVETAELMMAQSQYHRTEKILGLNAYVFRIYSDEGELVKELWRSPETQPLALREISYRDDGSQDILEATSVEFGNVGEVRPAGFKIKPPGEN